MNYWIFIANQNHWDWLEQKIGDVEPWNAKRTNGSIKPYFSEIQKGDKIIGYQAGKRSRYFVSLAEIERPLTIKDGKADIEIRKIMDFKKPISLYEARKIPPFEELLKSHRLNTTALPITEDEYNKLRYLADKT